MQKPRQRALSTSGVPVLSREGATHNSYFEFSRSLEIGRWTLAVGCSRVSAHVAYSSAVGAASNSESFREQALSGLVISDFA